MANTKDYKYELDTPCLTIDIDILEHNLADMQAAARAAGKNLRPHAKTHKCSLLAKKTNRDRCDRCVCSKGF